MRSISNYKFNELLFIILGIWSFVICWRIFNRRHIKGFLLIGISIIVFFMPSNNAPILKDIFFMVSQLLFYSGIISLCTIEKEKVRLLANETKGLDWILGRIPTVDSSKSSLSSVRNNIFMLVGCLSLIAFSLIDYVLYKDTLTNILPFLIVGIVVGVYTLIFARRT
jgi:hypothetical protein